MKIHEGVKLEMCKLLHHLCDVQLRHRVEYSVGFSQDYMKTIQQDQLRRYVEIKQSDMPSAQAAKKTKEFRCPPRDQMNTILGFKNVEVCKNGFTNIKKAEGLNLCERVEESVYVEGIN